MDAQVFNPSLFRTSGHAELYAKYRFKPPQTILKYILEYVAQEIQSPYTEALDVGCGNGQSTELLAEHFGHVTGIDISEAQIEQAIKLNQIANVSYRVNNETDLPFENSQLQLITASECHHWLDLDRFYEEAKRVVAPKGVICIYFYKIPFLVDVTNPGSTLEQLIDHVLHVELKGFGDQRFLKIEKGFDFKFPFENVEKQTFTVDRVLTLSDVCGFILTWSPYQALLAKDSERAEKIVDDFRQKALLTIDSRDRNPDEVNVTLRFTYYMIMGRNSLP